jgi:uncharacterized membrane protein
VFEFVVAFCLLLLVILLAFRWFPKTATMCVLLYIGAAIALAPDLLGDTASEVLLFTWLMLVIGLPIYWTSRRYRRARRLTL